MDPFYTLLLTQQSQHATHQEHRARHMTPAAEAKRESYPPLIVVTFRQILLTFLASSDSMLVADLFMFSLTKTNQ